MDMDTMLLEQTLREDERRLNENRKVVYCWSCAFANVSENVCSKHGCTLSGRDGCIEGKLKTGVH